MRRALTWLSTARLATAILFVALFAMAVQFPAGNDTWWHLRAGQVTLQTGHILQTDLFSHTRYGQSWVNHSWLSQVILYWLFDQLSYAGLELWVRGIVTATFVLVFLQMKGNAFVRAFVTMLAAATSAVIWAARPQLLSFLLTAAVAHVLYLYKWEGVNRLWVLPPLFVLWVNLHAGYALGFMVLAGYLVGEVLNHALNLVAPSDTPVIDWPGLGHLLGISLLSALLLVINPNTTRMWTYYLDTVGIGALQDFIQEWQSPDFHPIHMQPFIWLLLATLAAIGLSEQRPDASDLTLIAMFAYAALLAGRNIAPFALVTAPVLSRHVTATLNSWRRKAAEEGRLRLRGLRRRPTPLLGALNWGILFLVIALGVANVWRPLWTDLNERRQEERYPMEAIQWIEENDPPGRMFNPYNWGGMLIWRLWPEQRVFVDGRTDLFGDEVLGEYITVQAAQPGFDEILDKYGVGFVLARPHDPLSTVLACTGDWEHGYKDGQAVVWLREKVE